MSKKLNNCKIINLRRDVSLRQNYFKKDRFYQKKKKT